MDADKRLAGSLFGWGLIAEPQGVANNRYVRAPQASGLDKHFSSSKSCNLLDESWCDNTSLNAKTTSQRYIYLNNRLPAVFFRRSSCMGAHRRRQQSAPSTQIILSFVLSSGMYSSSAVRTRRILIGSPRNVYVPAHHERAKYKTPRALSFNHVQFKTKSRYTQKLAQKKKMGLLLQEEYSLSATSWSIPPGQPQQAAHQMAALVPVLRLDHETRSRRLGTDLLPCRPCCRGRTRWSVASFQQKNYIVVVASRRTGSLGVPAAARPRGRRRRPALPLGSLAAGSACGRALLPERRAATANKDSGRELHLLRLHAGGDAAPAFFC